MGKIKNLISSKIIIGDLLANYGLNDISAVSSIYDFISMGMQIMELDGYFVRKIKKAKVINYSTNVPCDGKYLIVVLGSGQMDNVFVQSVTYNEGLLVDTISEVGSTQSLYRIPIKNAHLIGTQASGIITDAVKDRGYINNNKLHVNFESGDVIFVYFGLPCDCDGYPMIIDNALVRQALPFYIIWRLSLGGYKHPTLSMQDAFNMWNSFYPQARNNVNYPDLEELQAFTEMNTNPMLGDMSNYFFQN